MSRSWLVAALLVGAACGGDRPQAEPRAPTAATAEGGMCAEHGVLEAVCTKCNPKLIPVFQAKGDWCQEHGFPESFCPICHPERGGRPAGDVADDDGAPADGTRVRMKTREAARLAGITTAPAITREGGARLHAVATITWDAARRAEVNARSPGVVRAVKADVGARVAARAPLAVIDSAAVGADRSRLTAAAARVRAAEQSWKREKELHAGGLAPEKAVLAAEQELAAARAELQAAEAALGVVGGRGGGAGGYTLAAPLAGTVTRRTATVGRLVGVEEALFEIVDTSAMWAEVEVPETELLALAVGQPVTIVVDVLGDRRFEGTIAWIAPEVDPRTRTVRARVALPNPDGALKANMFAEATIALGDARPTVMVPRASVQRAGDVDLVFVQLAEDDFETRRVTLGAADGELVEVVRGVRAGEPVVTQGSFLLKTETLKGAIGAGCCEVD